MLESPKSILRRALLIARAREDKEKVDPMPVEIPGFQQEDMLSVMVRQMVAQEISKIAVKDDFGSFEDEDDFEDDGEPEWRSPHEVYDLEPEQEEQLGDDAPSSPEDNSSPPLQAGSPDEPPAETKSTN